MRARPAIHREFSCRGLYTQLALGFELFEPQDETWRNAFGMGGPQMIHLADPGFFTCENRSVKQPNYAMLQTVPCSLAMAP
jgi:hypothetical protein